MRDEPGSEAPRAAAGGLAARIAETTRRALARGALAPIETVLVPIEEAGVRFLVRRVSSLAARPPAAGATSGPPRDAFARPDPDLTVSADSATHLALLNKYPVLPHHLLLVTRRFVPQEALLDDDDFAALAGALAEIDGLAFYNGGAVAGASQPRKHLQLVPLPLEPGGPPVPIEPWLAQAPPGPAPGRLPAAPFAHAFLRLPDDAWRAPAAAAAALAAGYRALLAAVGITARPGPGPGLQSTPYNLLATRGWMLLVPRAREAFAGVSINALGFAGSLFVGDDAALETLRRVGPLAALRAVTA